MDIALFYTAIFAAIALVLLLIAIVVAYLRLLGKFMSFKEEKKKDASSVTLEQAQSRAQKMIEDARVKAQQVIQNAQIFSGNQAGILEREIQNTSRVNAAKFEQYLKVVQSESIKILSNVPNKVSSDLNTQLTGIRSMILTEIEKASSNAKAQVDSAYKRAEVEVKNYKNQRLKQIDDSIISILEEVSRKVLARQISHDEHEKLVMKALEEAKQQHVFFEEQEEAIERAQI